MEMDLSTVSTEAMVDELRNRTNHMVLLAQFKISPDSIYCSYRHGNQASQVGMVTYWLDDMLRSAAPMKEIKGPDDLLGRGDKGPTE